MVSIGPIVSLNDELIGNTAWLYVKNTDMESVYDTTQASHAL